MKIAVCAGEKSGDALGYELLQDLKQNIDSVNFIGVGGSQMESLGLKSFFPIKEISYMGLIDPLMNIKKILRRRQDFIKFLKDENPDIFIGIDSPSFNSGICKVLRNDTDIKTVQYVCPQFWAWRYGRVHKSLKVHRWLQRNSPIVTESKGLTPFAVCMPEKYKISEDPVACYRKYYLEDKVRFAKWAHSQEPDWWKNEKNKA